MILLVTGVIGPGDVDDAGTGVVDGGGSGADAGG